MDNEPRLGLTLNGMEFEGTRRNIELYKHLGGLAIYDHAFIIYSEEETLKKGFRLWRDHQEYPVVHDFIVEHNFPQHLYLPVVQANDRLAYERHIEALCEDMSDNIPEIWDND